MKNSEDILRWVPSEALIFTQKPWPRNLGNPKAIGFVNMENRLELPSNEDFGKAETMIGEFLKPTSTDLPCTIEIVAKIISSSAKHTSPYAATTKPYSLTPKDTTHHLGV